MEIDAKSGRIIKFNTSDAERLRISSTGQALFSLNGTSSAPTIANADDTNTGLYWPTDSDTLALAVGGSDAVYIDSSRNVLIGASSFATTTKFNVSSNKLNANYPINCNIQSKDQGLGEGGSIGFTGFNAGGFESFMGAVQSVFESSGTTVNDYKAGLRFLVRAESTGSLTERLRIKSTGQLNFSGLASAPTGAVGDLYYNSTSNTLQYHNNSAFQQISRKYSTALAGTNTSFTVTHNFGTRDVTVQVRKSGSTYDLVYTDIQMTDTNTVTVIFATSVTGSDYTVTVIG
jgi:hypothetical protein